MRLRWWPIFGGGRVAVREVCVWPSGLGDPGLARKGLLDALIQQGWRDNRYCTAGRRDCWDGPYYNYELKDYPYCPGSDYPCVANKFLAMFLTLNFTMYFRHHLTL